MVGICKYIKNVQKTRIWTNALLFVEEKSVEGARPGESLCIHDLCFYNKCV